MKTTWKEKLFWILYACALVILFLMSSTNLLIKEKTAGIYRVSVIVEDSKDEYYANLKKGMDQAAVEYNVDVNFITLYERNNSTQQRELFEREMEVGTQAVILAPVDYQKTAAALEDMTVDVPLLILNNEEPSGNKVMANISMDYFEAGRKLAGAVGKELEQGTAVYLFTEGLQYSSNRRFYDGIMSALSETGCKVLLIEKAFQDRYNQVLEERVQKEADAVMVALDTESLMEMAGIIDGDQERYGRFSLYGPGATLKILRYMENGIIKGVITGNSYDAGYLSMEMAVEAIDNKNIKENILLDSFFLQRNDITKKEYEKMLYPIH